MQKYIKIHAFIMILQIKITNHYRKLLWYQPITLKIDIRKRIKDLSCLSYINYSSGSPNGSWKFLFIECQLIKVEEMMEWEKSPFCNPKLSITGQWSSKPLNETPGELHMAISVSHHWSYITKSVMSGQAIQQEVQSATYGVNFKKNLMESQALISL